MTSDEDPVQGTSQFGFLVNLVARQLERRMADALRPLGLTPAYLPVIISLGESQPKTQTELATTLDVRQPTMAQTLGRMERDGLINRVPDETDRRVTAITLTDKTWALVDQIKDIGTRIIQDALTDLPPERGPQLVADLDTVSLTLAKRS